MPNPNELERQQQELDFLRDSLANGIHSKATKEYLLREIRTLERALGIPSKPYNGGS